MKAEQLPPLRAIDQELAARCEASLETFIEEAWPYVDPVPYIRGRHVGMLAEYAEAWIDGEIPYLLINIPPGHMKSLLCSVMLNAWTWTLRERAGLRFMATSYRDALALRDADKTRNLIRTPWYQARWGSHVGGLREYSFQIRRDQDQKSRFANELGGYRFSTSISGIMGEGGDFVILDDPHNVEQAESDDVRDETVRKIRLALPTRVRSKRGGVLVIMQRLHERDYAGRMLADELDMVHLCLPGRYEHDHPHVTTGWVLDSGRELSADFRTKDGELLWPELYDEERLASLESQLEAYGVSGQIQQRPVPREGGMFKRAWFDDKFVDPGDVPKRGIDARGWDFAGSKRKSSPYTAGVKIRYAKGNVYIMHAHRKRLGPLQVEQAVKSFAKSDGRYCLIDYPQDPGQAGKSQAQAFARKLHGYRVHFSPESGSKEVRAEAGAAQAEAGNVYIVRGEWNDDFLDELCMFPGGKYADQVDAFSRAYHRVIRGGRVRSGAVKGAS